jgi:hypothetical protein
MIDEYMDKFNLIKSELDRNPIFKNLESLDKSLICMKAIISGVKLDNLKYITI